jgi:hypothetical protein
LTQKNILIRKRVPTEHKKILHLQSACTLVSFNHQQLNNQSKLEDILVLSKQPGSIELTNFDKLGNGFSPMQNTRQS